ncbi:MAG: MFS transporter [Bryobacteraceae bacterium]
MPKPAPTLWRHPDFLKLWAGQSISELGSRITAVGLPILAAQTLNATPAQMGLLAALSGFASLLFGLPIGAWVDRVRRRPVMIGADIARAALLATIPLAAGRGMLTLPFLYIVAALTGVLTICFDVAYQSYVPSLVDRDHVLEANSKLAISAATAEVAGPAITGVLIEWISAPLAILWDAVSFLCSAVSVSLLRRPEPPPDPHPEDSNFLAGILAGLHFLWTHRGLRALAGRSATIYLFFGFFGSLYMLYGLRELKMSASLLGIVIATGGIGNMFGALYAARLAGRFGIRRTLLYSSSAIALAFTLIPLASGSVLREAAFLIGAQVFGDCAIVICTTNELSFRQQVTPENRLGRVNSAMQILSLGVAPLGALGAGFIAEAIGLRSAIAIAVAGIWLSNVWLLNFPGEPA